MRILRVQPIAIAVWVLVAGVVGSVCASPAHAWEVNPDNTIPNTVANSLIANADGGDWNSAVLLIELVSGSVYSAPEFDSLQPQLNLWTFVPELEFDSWVGIPGDGTGAVFGGAGDLGDFGPAVIADQKASVTWFNTDITNSGPTRIANMTLSNDAFGRWSVIAGFSGALLLTESGFVTNGVMADNPVAQGDLDGDGFVGINDLNLVLANWNRAAPPASIWADHSGDGFIGIDDLNTVLGNWNAGILPWPTGLPEPGSAALLLAGSAALLRIGRPA